MKQENERSFLHDRLWQTDKPFGEKTISVNLVLPPRQIKYPVDFDGELKIGEVRYDNMT